MLTLRQDISYALRPFLAQSRRGRLNLAQYDSPGNGFSRHCGTRHPSLPNPGLRLRRANLLGCFSSKLPQNRHPERSASQIDRVTEHLWRGVEGPRRCLSYPCRSDLFDHRSPHRRFPPRSSTGAENQELASTLLCPAAQPIGKSNSKASGAKRSSASFARSIPSSKTLRRPGDGR
jgi:hypothetical protein